MNSRQEQTMPPNAVNRSSRCFRCSTKEVFTLQCNWMIGMRRPRIKDLLRNGLDLIPVAIKLIGDLEWHYLPVVQVTDNRKNYSETNGSAVVEHFEVEHATVNVDLGMPGP
jgi:hypothetical protein